MTISRLQLVKLRFTRIPNCRSDLLSDLTIIGKISTRWDSFISNSCTTGNEEDSSSLHNLALMYAGRKLPIASVKHYKRALSLGETLSAANLGFEYLDSGMADEAKALIEQAMEAENHVSRVEKCLAEIVRRTEEEAEKEGVLIANAETYRKFFCKDGQGSFNDPSGD